MGPLCCWCRRLLLRDRRGVRCKGSRRVMATGHRPVMLESSVAALRLAPEDSVVDATFGGGGHSRLILAGLGPDGSLVGIDRDPEAAGRASDLLEDPRFEFVSGAYDLALWAMVEERRRVDAILFDLGLSSFQVDELSRVLSEYGDVPRGEAGRVAREVVRRRPLAVTTDLYEAVRAAVGWKERGGNPANRIFQAVRVRVNDELGSLSRALEASERLLTPDGRLVVITSHSGEDRLVKRFISGREGRCVCPPELPVCVCGPKPVFRRAAVMTPSRREIEENPRSASARLRAAIRTAEPPVDAS